MTKCCLGFIENLVVTFFFRHEKHYLAKGKIVIWFMVFLKILLIRGLTAAALSSPVLVNNR